MKHPWFNLRILITGLFISVWYLPFFAIGSHFNLPHWTLFTSLFILLWGEYLIGVKRALWSVNAT